MRRSRSSTASTCSRIRVVRDCMSVILRGTPQPTFSAATSACRGPTSCIRWVGMRSDFPRSSTRFKRECIRKRRRAKPSRHSSGSCSDSDSPMTGIASSRRLSRSTTSGHSGSGCSATTRTTTKPHSVRARSQNLKHASPPRMCVLMTVRPFVGVQRLPCSDSSTSIDTVLRISARRL